MAQAESRAEHPKPIPSSLPATTSPIHLQDCAVTIGGRLLLSTVNLRVEAGELVLIEGASGSGKSLLLRALWGDIPLASGTAEVAGLPLVPLTAAQLSNLRRKLGIVLEQPLFLEDEHCLTNIALPLILAGAKDAEWRSRGMKALLEFELSPAALRKPTDLSGGERLRLQMARALIHRPVLLLADEPFVQADAATLTLLSSQLDRARSQGTAIVMTASRTAPRCDDARRLILRDGTLQ